MHFFKLTIENMNYCLFLITESQNLVTKTTCDIQKNSLTRFHALTLTIGKNFLN